MLLGPTQVSFICCVLVSLTDTMGVFFTAPVMVPYGQQINASTAEIGAFSTVFYIFGIFSLAWMPWLADTKGIRIAMVLSVLGTAISYAVQGSAHHFMPLGAKAGVWTMMAGRAISGFFSGSTPMIRSHIADISYPDMAVLKFRSIIMWASVQAGNFALAPIAGLVSRFGLHLPWYVSAGVSFVVLLFVALFFKDAEEIFGSQDSSNGADEESGDAEKSVMVQKSKSNTSTTGSKSTYKDPILWLVMVAHAFLFLTASALLLVLPFLLEYPAFGQIDVSSVEQSRENVAAATSLVMVPHGVLNLAFSTVGFLFISSKIGDRACLRIGSLGGAVMFCLYGFGASEFWHLLVYHGLSGMFVGLMVPAITPTLTSYNLVVHPTKKSQASAFPMLGMQIGQICGPLLFGFLLGEGQDRTVMNIIWLSVGLMWLVGYILLDISFEVIRRHPAMRAARKSQDVSAEQIQSMLTEDAKDYDAFVQDMCDLVRGMLTPGHEEFRGMELWSGVAQRFVERVFRNSVPRFRTDPEGHLEDVAAWVARVGTEQDFRVIFAMRYPFA
eukprot:s5219_g6.t1